MTRSVILATHAEGTLRVFTRTNGDGLRTRAVLDVEDASPELLATLSADLADALGWLPIELPARPPRAEAVEAPQQPELPPVRRGRPPGGGNRDAERQLLVAVIRQRPGVTTRELADGASATVKHVSNVLVTALARGLVRKASTGAGQPARWYPT